MRAKMELRKKIIYGMIFIFSLFGLSIALVTRMIMFKEIDLVIVFVTLLIIILGAFLAYKISAYLNQLIAEVERLTKCKERQIIALDLHDNCAQDLANLIKRLELCEKLFKIDPSKALLELNGLKASIRAHLGKARQIIYGLKPGQESEDFILLSSIGEYINDFRQSSGMNIKANISNAVNNALPAEKAKHIFFIIKEALTNIKKHSRAKNVELDLDYDGINELSIKIKDDGLGFDVKGAEISASSCGKFGLMSMSQRARSLGGTLAINSIPNQGTQIIVRIPYAIVYNI